MVYSVLFYMKSCILVSEHYFAKKPASTHTDEDGSYQKHF